MKGIAYLIQATLILIWWIGLFFNKKLYNAFSFPEISKVAFNAFLLPDLIVIAFLSIVNAYNKKDELGYVILGGFAFATLYCINASILTKGGYLATTIMTLGLCYNLFLVFNNKLFKESGTNNIVINGLKTFIQIICVWLITLFVFPMLLMNAFGGVPDTIMTCKILGCVLFIAFSAIGLYSAYVIVVYGSGTPLPLDQTNKLVVNGPYKFVRNPMAIAGIGQGISLSIYWGSIHVFIYAVFGAIVWHLVVRPIEEKNMLLRFGNDYEVYKKKVKCWIPNFS